jgi:hypothetical protein
VIGARFDEHKLEQEKGTSEHEHEHEQSTSTSTLRMDEPDLTRCKEPASLTAESLWAGSQIAPPRVREVELRPHRVIPRIDHLHACVVEREPLALGLPCSDDATPQSERNEPSNHVGLYGVREANRSGELDLFVLVVWENSRTRPPCIYCDDTHTVLVQVLIFNSSDPPTSARSVTWPDDQWRRSSRRSADNDDSAELPPRS